MFDWLKKKFSRPGISSPRSSLEKRSQSTASLPGRGVREFSADEELSVSEDMTPGSSTMRALLKQSSRQQQLLEMIYKEHGKRLAGISRQVQGELPCDSVFDFVEVFVLYLMYNGTENPELEKIWTKFVVMLDAQNMEVIIDQGEPFDSRRHQLCDTRWNGKFPENSVLEVLCPGLVIQGEVYRPAMVVVNQDVQPAP